jgi:hypothetical protein
MGAGRAPSGLIKLGEGFHPSLTFQFCHNLFLLSEIFDQSKRVANGMVRKHKSVESMTQLAESSVSLLWISAMLWIIAAQGVADRITRLASKE